MARVDIFPNPTKACNFCFEKIVLPLWQEMKLLGLATGSTPTLLYALIVKAYQEGRIPVDRIRTINLDEYVGLLPSHPQSYWTFMRDNFFKWVPIDLKMTRVPFGALDFNEELNKVCIEMELWIENYGPVTLWILGIGENGHVGFCEPGTPLDSRYHITQLVEITRRANKRFFNDDISQVPKLAITAGIGTIRDALHLLQMAFGIQKEWAVSASLLGHKSVWIPSSLLQDHQDWRLVVDQEAGAGVIRFIEKNKIEPDSNGFYEVPSEAGITHQVKIH